MIDVEIREAMERDFKQVYGLLGQLWPEQELDEEWLREVFCQGINSPDQVYLVAVEESCLVGIGTLSIVNKFRAAGKSGYINELVVDETQRRRGIGTRLLDELIAIAQNRGCRRVELDSAFHREKAHRFYEAREFEKRALLFSKRLD